MTERAALRVLMAEDEPLAAEVIEEGLLEAGFEVLAANDGQEALDLASSGAGFDLLLTDLKMPRLDGKQNGYNTQLSCWRDPNAQLRVAEDSKVVPSAL